MAATSLGGTRFAGLTPAGVGFSSHGLIPFSPATITDLPPGTIPTYDGQLWLAGAIPIEDLASTLSGSVVVDIELARGSLRADPVDGVTIAGSTPASPIPMLPLGSPGDLSLVMKPDGSFAGTVTGTETINLPVYIPPGQYAQRVTNAAVCGAEAVVNSLLCGFDTVADADRCGTQVITDAGRCGQSTITDATACGEDWTTSADQCGTSESKSIEKCGSSCAKSAFKKCKCDLPNSYNVPRTCTVPNSCTVPNTCNVGRSCMGVSTCNWQVNLPDLVSGSIQGSLSLTIGANGSNATIAGDGTLEFCPVHGACTTLSAVSISILPKATLCARGFTGIADVLCVDF